MPIYEYRCTKCDRSFEAFVRPHRDKAECPSCHGTRLVRQMSVFRSGAISGHDAAESLAAAGRCGG
ncbi:MAG: zinc ribbon domain-containing protein, partial [Candidatus Binataceae bacterium]